MANFTRDNPRKLSDILGGKDYEELVRQFAEIEAAPEYEPIPGGLYEADLIRGEMCLSQAGNTGYRCTFEVAAGDFRGRRVYHTFWLSERAMPYSKRDLKKLGISRLEQCETPVPPGIFCTLKVVERTEDDGTRRNEVRGIDGCGVRRDPTVDPDFDSPQGGDAEGGLTR